MATDTTALDPDEPLFRLMGESDAREVFEPTLATTGPWRTDAMHGGPPGALIARCVERALGEGEHVARLGVELEQPVPLEPLTIGLHRRQIARRVAHLEVEMLAGGRRVASARALLLRGDPLPEPTWVSGLSTPALPGPEGAADPPPPMHGGPVAYHCDAVEHRFVEGGFGIPGPSTTWIRLTRALVEGEPTAGLSALFAAADFGSAISQSFAAGSGVGLINVDVTVSFSGVPTGPWIWMEASGSLHPDGFGLAVSRIGDLAGQVGIVTQSQLGMATPG